MFDLKKNPIGLYEKALPSQLTIAEKLKITKQAGYDFFELSIDESDAKLARLTWDKTQRKALVNQAWQADLPILSICLSGHRKFSMGSSDPITRQRAMDIMKQAIQFAADIGIRIIQLAGYDVYYEPSTPTTRQLFLDGLKAGVDWAAKAGVMLAIEIMDYELMNSIKKAMQYVKQLNSPWLNVYPDIGNMSAWGVDPNEDFDLGKGHIVAIHIKETKPGIYRDVRFGAGTVDFEKMFAKLAQIGYRGPFLIEMWADSLQEPIQDVRDTIIWVKEKMKKSGLNLY
jgi:L-ribulose-5-phosphate 3-epimerase